MFHQLWNKYHSHCKKDLHDLLETTENKHYTENKLNININIKSLILLSEMLLSFYYHFILLYPIYYQRKYNS